MGRDEVLVEVHFYNVEGVCIGRMEQWADYKRPECNNLYRTPPEAVYFRVCSANNYSCNLFDRATQGYCPEYHGLATVSADDCLSASSIEGPGDFRVNSDSPDSGSESDSAKV